ncbi:PRC-barrel domain-containing protein [Devosia sp. LjRoot3]|uniref:PRC-barrel domain-containing protein n=1 Tax=Devosia sp. LjRoot3 TaxID=3342319 RepID=UPI003ECDA96C
MEVVDTSGMALGVVASVIGDDQDTPTGLVLSTNGGSIMVELADVQLINNRIVVSNLAD